MTYGAGAFALNELLTGTVFIAALIAAGIYLFESVSLTQRLRTLSLSAHTAHCPLGSLLPGRGGEWEASKQRVTSTLDEARGGAGSSSRSRQTKQTTQATDDHE